MRELIFLLSFLALSVAPLIGQEETAISATFDHYMSAVLNDEGEKAASFIDSQTIRSYDKTMHLIKYADSSVVAALPFMKKFYVLHLRHLESKENLLAMGGKELFIYAVENSTVGKIKNASLGDIQIAGDTATAGIDINGQKTLLTFHFVKEEGSWKIDLTAFNMMGEIPLDQSILNMENGENAYLINLIEESSGERVSTAIWQPLSPNK